MILCRAKLQGACLRPFLRKSNLPFLIILFCSACSHLGIKDGAALSEEQKVALANNQLKRKKMSGSGSISWRYNKSIAAPGVLIVEYPDRLRLEVQDPVGGVQALLVVDRGRFWWEDRQAKKAWTGRADHPKLAEILPLSLDPILLVRAILGQTLFDGILEYNDHLNEVIRWRPMQGKEVLYEDYAARFGLQFPNRIRISTGEGDQEKILTWEWEDWRPELPKNEKIFQIPVAASRGISLTRLP